jgi:hypothetical protein
MSVFWDVAPCNLADVYQRFRGITFETSVNIQHTTRRYIPEDGRLHTRRRENLKSQRGGLCSTEGVGGGNCLQMWAYSLRV